MLKNRVPVNNSTKGYLKDILFLQHPHFPLKNI